MLYDDVTDLEGSQISLAFNKSIKVFLINYAKS